MPNREEKEGWQAQGMEGLGILTHKKNDEFSKGAFERYAPIPEEVRSMYVQAREDPYANGEWVNRPARLGLGYLQAILAVLGGCIQACSFDPPGHRGGITVQRGIIYDLSWNEDASSCRHGGFPGGTPNFHVATLGIAQCIAMYLCGDRLQSQEFVDAWCLLLQQMEQAFPRERKTAWLRTQIEQACRVPNVRLALLGACDTLRVAMQYRIVSSQKRLVQGRRMVRVFGESVLSAEEGKKASLLEGSMLLDREQLLILAEAMRMTSSERHESATGALVSHAVEEEGMESHEAAVASVSPNVSETIRTIAPALPASDGTKGKMVQEISAAESGLFEGKGLSGDPLLNSQEDVALLSPQPQLHPEATGGSSTQGTDPVSFQQQSISPLLAVVRPFLDAQPEPSASFEPEKPPLLQKAGEESPTFYLSPSALMTALACEHRYGLKYLDHVTVPLSAAAWFGTLAHEIVEGACYGKSLQQSHREVWKLACPSIADVLEAWLPLELEYRAVLAAQREEKIRGLVSGWYASHPDYVVLKKQIQDYQSQRLSHLRWYPSASLLDYYRRSALLYMVDPSLVVLENLVMVEAEWLPVGGGMKQTRAGSLLVEMQGGEQDEDEAQSQVGPLLECVIGGIKFRGRPDYIAFAPDGEVILADLKTGKQQTKDQLARNLQLCIYREMLWQNGIAAADQPIRSGHIYLLDDGVEHLWDDGALHQQVLRRVAFQARLLARRREARELQPVYGTPHEVCSRCDYAEVCEWALAA